MRPESTVPDLQSGEERLFYRSQKGQAAEELAIVDSQIQLGNDLFTIKHLRIPANCTSGESELGCLFIFYSVPCKRNGWLTDAGFVVTTLVTLNEGGNSTANRLNRHLCCELLA